MSEEHLEFQEMNLNIRYDGPEEVWDKVGLIYQQLAGWMGYHNDIPYWFSFDEAQKHICASVESAGLQFNGLMPEPEWNDWRRAIKAIATQMLGYKVGEIEEGEVDF